MDKTTTTTTTTTTIRGEGYVLFADHQGHVAPIGQCFHATASRRLSSSIERHPPSTQPEIDSAYCPQCLSFHDVASASHLGFCPKVKCQKCPLCQSVLHIAVLEQACRFVCGFCRWDSSRIDLVAPCLDITESESAMEKLGEKLFERRLVEEQKEQFASTLKSLETIALDEIRRLKQPKYINRDSKSENLTWSMEALNKSLAKKSSSLLPSSNKGLGKPLSENSMASPSSSSLPTTIATAGHSNDSTVSYVSVTSLLLSPHQLPLPIPLCPRKSRRCRAEIAEGRPGILIKPKLNPLEGDTSLRSGHGQWFKKDSSALLVVPRITMERLDHTVVLLRVHNPTMGVVKLALGPSTYAGEPIFEDPTQRTPILKHILVDSLRRTVIDRIVLDTSFRAPQSEYISLDAVEDSFLDLGVHNAKVPPQVATWSSDTLGWIVQQGDKAWYALDIGNSECVPLALTIVVSKGSWESSLIKSELKDDTVTFDMVLIRMKK